MNPGKEDWELEYDDAVETMNTEQHSSIKEREEALAEREAKVREWESAQREQARNHFIGTAVIEESSFSQAFKFSSSGANAGENLINVIESMSGVTLPKAGALSARDTRSLPRGASGSSLTSGTPGTDDDIDWKPCYGSHGSLASISSAPTLSTVMANPHRHKASVGTPPLSPLAGDKFFNPSMMKQHIMSYTPKKGQPHIEGEAQFGGSSRKTSVGIVGTSGGSPQAIALPKEFEDLLGGGTPAIPQKGKPCYKYSRQKSTSNEFISLNDVRTIIKKQGAEPQG